MTYPSWIAPKEKDLEENKAKEPEGERIRAELIDFLERNKICGMLLDTPHHHVAIDFGPRLPDRIKQVLTVWGSIYVVESEDVKWQPAPQLYYAKVENIPDQVTITYADRTVRMSVIKPVTLEMVEKALEEAKDGHYFYQDEETYVMIDGSFDKAKLLEALNRPLAEAPSVGYEANQVDATTWLVKRLKPDGTRDEALLRDVAPELAEAEVIRDAIKRGSWA